MRVLFVAALSACPFVTAVAIAPAADGPQFARHGIRVRVPAGWWASADRMSSGVEPVFRLTLSDRHLRRTARDSGPCYGGIARQIQPDGVVAIVREALGADFKPERLHLRSRHFALPPRTPGQDVACLGDHATSVAFRQAGRGFYVWIAAGRRAPPARIAALLASLDGMTIAARA